jgi:Tol biopolymer transport system component
MYSFWSPDGNKIIFSTSTVYYIVNADGTGIKEINFPVFPRIYNPTFSPDGTKIMFISDDLTPYLKNICIAPVDISTYTIILSTGIDYTSIFDWKSDKVLLYIAHMQESYIVVMNSDGTGLKIIDDGWTTHAKLSPDGKKVVYEDKEQKLQLVNSDGSDKTKLTELIHTVFAWSSDSKKVAYNSNVRSSSIRSSFDNILRRTYLVNSDGSNVTNLNPQIQLFTGKFLGGGGPFFVSGNKIVYDGDGDVWIGDYTQTIDVPVDVVVPKQQGEVKVVVPEGGGEKGTINPDSGKPVSIGFKGSSPGKFTLRIFTQFGEEIYKEEKDVSTAEGWFSWIPGNIASGVYLVSVEGPGVKIFKKIPILR